MQGPMQRRWGGGGGQSDPVLHVGMVVFVVDWRGR